MDLHLPEPTVLLPALLVTLLAVLAARALLSRNSGASSTPAAADKKRSVGYGDEPPPSRALAEPAPIQKVKPT